MDRDGRAVGLPRCGMGARWMLASHCKVLWHRIKRLMRYVSIFLAGFYPGHRAFRKRSITQYNSCGAPPSQVLFHVAIYYRINFYCGSW